MGKVRIGNVQFDAITMSELGRLVVRSLQRGDRCRLAFANPEFIIEAEKNDFLRSYLERCDLTLADGIGVLWAARVLRRGALPERVTGTEFVEQIARISEEYGFRVFFLGGKPGVAELARERIKLRFPAARIVGARDGYFSSSSDVVREINESRADILMVCMGNPRQEAWIDSNFDELSPRLCFGNGGALDFASGCVRRAPPLVQKLGLEWFYRLLQDLSFDRARRQFRLIIFVLKVLGQRY